MLSDDGNQTDVIIGHVNR